MSASTPPAPTSAPAPALPEGAYAEVIGDPIAQSKSPEIHAHWLAADAGLAARYERTRVGRDGLADYLAQRRGDPAWLGCNVTMPIKLEAIRLADEATDRAVAAGAANLLLPREGRVIAGNSDVGAVMLLLARLHEAGRPMARLHLYGTGGAARAVLVAAAALGHGGIVIHARNLQKAVQLAVQFGLAYQPVPLDTPPEGDGVINATPLGMVGRECLNCDVSRLGEEGWVFDMVSAPVETDLLKAAKARGLGIVDGIDMLVEQAAASYELFFGRAPDRRDDAALLARLRA
ncbi:shikimate dehydrogenase family protein [Sphingomicrobium astaxanthinifaciens]|uniref:shikimate dehydrogenase family protein n=1 Tax=Sphingomicrobium astaxanthinifaciens TaxID=1227949 RepID=UPI001FCC9133|nr:shikimate dehydrogenase [Sphingomicrobium astaxanthinifaciens]MCJ7421171.1 shikimate dehydrogenase [Sphingomicrobium astaxanthinifaciens]